MFIIYTAQYCISKVVFIFDIMHQLQSRTCRSNHQ